MQDSSERGTSSRNSSNSAMLRALGEARYSFDVTNRLGRPERHLKLAVGLDYLDACPVRGLRRGGGCEQMHARVLVSAPLLQVQQQ